MRRCSFALARKKTAVACISRFENSALWQYCCLAGAIASVLFPSSFSIAHLNIALLITVIWSFTRTRLVFFKENNYLKQFYFKAQTIKLIDSFSWCVSRLTSQNPSKHCVGGYLGTRAYFAPAVSRTRGEWSSHVLTATSIYRVPICAFSCHSTACTLLWLPPLFSSMLSSCCGDSASSMVRAHRF